MGFLVKVLGAIVAWVVLTILTVVTYNEFVAHGQEHAFIKELMNDKGQHSVEHQQLRELIQLVIRQQQAAPKPGGD